METKKCKYCKTDIDKTAKICPNCRKSQGNTLLKILLCLIIIIIVINTLASACAIIISDSIGESVKDTEKSYLDINGKNSFKINESFENKYLKITMTESNLNFKDYSEYFKPKDGYSIAMAKFEVENIGEEDQYITSYDFNGYVNNVAMEKFYYAKDNYKGITATISSDKKTTGYVFFEIPKDTTKLTIEYDASWLDNNNIEFIVE